MSIWPYWPVWPILLGLCAVASLWNWRAALALAAVIVAVQGVKALSLPHAQIVFFALYVTAGLIAWFLIDRVAGYTMALVGFVYLAHIFGVVPQYPKVIIAEAVIVLGLIVGAINGGQSGGLLAIASNFHSGGILPADSRRAVGVTRSASGDQSVSQED